MIFLLFEYDAYKNYLFYGALVEFLIGAFLIIFAIYNLKNSARYRHSGNVSYFIIIIIIILIFSLSILYSSFVKLSFGIHLAFENETKFGEKTGSIENIKEMKYIYVSYEDEGKVTCQLVTVDGEKYLFVTTGDLEIGDSITIDYLPKSRVVLEWEYDLN